jgi:hypothetical protein
MFALCDVNSFTRRAKPYSGQICAGGPLLFSEQ